MRLYRYLCLFIATFIYLGFSQNVFASGSKIGANVTDHFEEWDRAANAVGPGGFITIMPKICDISQVQKLLDDHPEINIILRTHYPGEVPVANQAISWVATLGTLRPHNNVIFIMPWNEPNFDRENGGLTDVNEIASLVKDYTDVLFANLSQAGLLHHGYEVISPMTGISHYNARDFMRALGASYWNSFYGVAIALYDFESCGGIFCHPDNALNISHYRNFLSEVGVGGATIFAPELGIVAPSNYCGAGVPDCPIFEVGPMVSMTQRFLNVIFPDSSFIVATPLSYNPEISDHSPWLWGTAYEDLIRNQPDGSPISQSPPDTSVYQAWLRTHPMITCLGGCLAVNPSYCSPANHPPSMLACSGIEDQGYFRPHAYSVCSVRPVPKSTSTYATSFKVIKEVSINAGQIRDLCPDNKYYPKYTWSADIFETYELPKLPMAGFGKSVLDQRQLAESKYLADYLEGTVAYDTYNYNLVNSFNRAGVFRKLTSASYQDTLKCNLIATAKIDSRYNYSVFLHWRNEDQSAWRTTFDIARIAASSGHLLPRFINIFNLFRELVQILISTNIDMLCGLPISPCKSDLARFDCPPADPEERFWFNFAHPIQAHLWPAVPMFTREDTPGQATLRAQYPPGTFINRNRSPDGIGSGRSITYPLSVPHLARLNDVSRSTYNLLMPAALVPGTLAQADSSAALAQQETTSFVVAAPDSGDNLGFYLEATIGYEEPHAYVNVIFHPQEPNVCDGDIKLGLDSPGNIIAGPNGWNGSGGGTYVYEGNWTGSPFVINRGETKTVTYYGIIHRGPRDCTGRMDAITCRMSVDRNGRFSTNCGPAVPPAPVCGKNGPFTAAFEDPLAQKDYKDPRELDNLRKSSLRQTLVNTNAYPDGGVDKAIVDGACHINPLTHLEECDEIEFTYSTGINTTIQMPYLNDIWTQLAREKKSGIFNAITPGMVSAYIDINSKSDVVYGTSTLGVTVQPSAGNVYFPHLQGIYNTQNCVSQRLLMPANQGSRAACPSFRQN